MFKQTLVLAALAMTLAVPLTQPGSAQPRSAAAMTAYETLDRSSRDGRVLKADAGDVILATVISEAERLILADYARRHPGAFVYDDGGAATGAKKGSKAGKGNKGLPPGIAMNLQRGKPLPPGLRDRHIPADLQAMLPARRGTRLVPVGDDVVLVDWETQVILDVVVGILRGIEG